ncbi:MAG: hypothetical protein NZ581_09160, partial [Candidatus Caldarchaeum sp.]|nr:hypothetical protein [Candidatus Caldarchaeum sp.]MDW8436341.1 hypothetical protein [Candidatus Caldarchaeum sp.]
LMTRTGEPDEQLFSILIRDQLADVGIRVNIVTVDFATYLARQQRFEFQMATVKYWIDPLWVYQLFHSDWIGKGAWTNNFQYSNPELDRLLDQWLAEPNRERQVQLLQRVGTILSKDLPAIMLYKVIWPNVLSANFEGPSIPVGKYVFYDPLKDIFHVPSQKAVATQTATPVQTPGVVTQTIERTVTRFAVTTEMKTITQTVVVRGDQADQQMSTTALLIAAVVALIGVSAFLLRKTMKKTPTKQT